MKIAAACKQNQLCAPAEAEVYLLFNYQKGALVGRECLEGPLPLDALTRAGVKSLICAGTVSEPAGTVSEPAGTVSDPAAGMEIFGGRSGNPLEALLDVVEAGLIADPDLCGGACGTCSGCH